MKGLSASNWCHYWAFSFQYNFSIQYNRILRKLRHSTLDGVVHVVNCAIFFLNVLEVDQPFEFRYRRHHCHTYFSLIILLLQVLRIVVILPVRSSGSEKKVLYDTNKIHNNFVLRDNNTFFVRLHKRACILPDPKWWLPPMDM